MTAASEGLAPLFSVRPGRAGDHPFVYSSWIGSDRFSRRGQACARVYQQEQSWLVRDILARPGVTLRVACAADDDDALLGWAVLATEHVIPCIYYVYVKKGTRRLGIASALVGPLVTQRCEFTHEPVICHKDFRPPSAWSYNPFRNHR